MTLAARRQHLPCSTRSSYGFRLGTLVFWDIRPMILRRGDHPLFVSDFRGSAGAVKDRKEAYE